MGPWNIKNSRNSTRFWKEATIARGWMRKLLLRWKHHRGHIICTKRGNWAHYPWTGRQGAEPQTIFPEISAQWSLLEPSFRYLSPGSEGEKCRPLNHMWQTLFIHLVQRITSHFYIYIKVYQFFFPTWKCVLVLCFSKTLSPRLFRLPCWTLYVLVRIDTK